MSAREVALRTLTAVEQRDAWANLQLKKELSQAGLDRRDAALATRLCLGVLQNKLLLDYYIAAFSTIKPEKMEYKVRDNLRLALYQLLFLTRIPASAAVNEAVDLTKKYCKNPRAAGMVNGILRNMMRSIDNFPKIPRKDQAEYFSLRYSHPKWLVEEFGRSLPSEELEELLSFNNGEAPTTVQVNTCRCTTEEAVALLEEEGVSSRLHPWLPDCLLLQGTGSFEQLCAYADGILYAQDPAARLTILAAAPQPLSRVLDVCAAPGGKSFACAIQMEDRGEIYALDYHPHKKRLIEESAARLGLASIQAGVQDARKYRAEWAGQFDTVLADVPCSGLGVIRKKPEIRYKSPGLMADIPALQLEILRTASAYVKPGGMLLYATCTLRREENEDVVVAFLKENEAFSLESFTLPGPVGQVETGMVTLWPHRTETDGFFIARLRRQV